MAGGTWRRRRSRAGRGQETTGNQERRRSGMADGERIHTFFLSPPTHRTRGWFLSTHSRVACSSVGRNNVMLCYGGASRTSVVEGGGALWRARRSISPREKRRPLGGVGQSPARCHRPSRRRPGGTNGRMRALSPGACRGSLGLGRIKALAAQLDAHLGPIDANALRRTSARPCSASRTS